jgi:hypothetical protein
MGFGQKLVAEIAAQASKPFSPDLPRSFREHWNSGNQRRRCDMVPAIHLS